MVRGEFLAMQRIHDVKPDFVPRPIGYGTYEELPSVHFLLCEFCDMETKLPDIEPFTRLMSEVHIETTSPSGKFGFDCLTYHGNVPVEHGWHDSWEQYFTTTTRALLETEQTTRGRDDTISKLTKPFFEEVVVRLLRPLETNGSSIKPSLIHGDLWHGNVAVNKQTGKPVIFDAAGFYAHNECRSIHCYIMPLH
jgi:protein-ribulosamine 3-kinase